MTSFDAIIIGTGQAGPALARKLAGAGWKVAVVERGKFGGTCVNTGCTPTKTLVASAYAVHTARRGGDYGFAVDGKITVDMKRVKARKDTVSGRSSQGVEKWLKGTSNLTVIEGHARFESPATVRVNGDLLEAEKIFINVGGRALVPPMPGLDQIEYLTNSSMMEVDSLPEHLIVIGGSYIGLEFGQMYRRFGAKVTVVERMEKLSSSGGISQIELLRLRLDLDPGGAELLDAIHEALAEGISKYGRPKEVLTDQGRQYFAWRGKSEFQRLLERHST